jgi:hypothetical protein
MLLQHLTKLAAACAIDGDLQMAQALVKGSTPMIAFAMDRWPSYTEELKQEFDGAGNVVDLPSSEETATTTEEETHREDDV